MQLRRVAIHNVNKDQGQVGANVEMSEALLPIDPAAGNLIQRLAEIYGAKKNTYAVFDETAEKVFPLRFAGFAADPTDEKFLEFSRATTLALRDTIEGLAPARGGYLVFAEYAQQGKNFVSVFFIRNAAGIFFDRDPNTNVFRINPTVHIDLEKLAMACRINLAMHANRSGKYLSFVKYNVRELSGYFTNWISAVEREDSTTYTRALYAITRDIPPPVDQTGNVLSRDELRRQVHTYVTAQPDKIINIQTLSETLYGDSQRIQQFAQERGIIIDTEFKSDSREMKRFVKVDLRADGITMQFSEGDLGTRIRLAPEAENVVLIESGPLAVKLREEIDARQ
jgi:nucleoid-associated protein